MQPISVERIFISGRKSTAFILITQEKMKKIALFITKIIDFLYKPFQKLLPEQLFRYAACGGGNMVLDWFLYFITYNFIIGHELVYIHLGVNTICLTPHIATLCIVFPITLLTGFWLNK